MHYGADLQSVHEFRYYDNMHVALYTAYAHSGEREMSASACTRSMAGYYPTFITITMGLKVKQAVGFRQKKKK